eukprot:CAMPEP_0198343450 /NCGR_PEP_ID=MMETSP1450-20131203/60299_1 /TAXON_ID=753684 ORGANISM="Madagascaria erythrocladiodes, Strain CCMP3234" /NCGR_SAMPLE_ID=MMETSP1450 /ASSEMBLY_ACC=CAM_ASM_001115 /LENGTH=61 /DNA_ID=CAMNT_0044048629 /DNA_START=76 /DNA_END=258 /DNA_ORIENTATION=-
MPPTKTAAPTADVVATSTLGAGDSRVATRSAQPHLTVFEGHAYDLAGFAEQHPGGDDLLRL